MTNAVKRSRVQTVARAGSVVRAVASVALALLGCSVLGGCDKATKPAPAKYSVIFADRGAAQSIFIADPDSNMVVDSIPNVGDVWQLAASPDGHWLYLELGEDRTHRAGLYRYDLQTLAPAGYLATPGVFCLLENGRTLAVGRDSTYIVDAESFTVEEAWDGLVGGPRGLIDGTIIVGARPGTPPWSSNQLAAYDIRTGAYDTITVASEFTIFDAFPLPDRRRVLVVGRLGPYRWLYVVDLIRRESAPVMALGPGAGSSAAFGRDLAFVTNSESLDDPELNGCGQGTLLLFSTKGAFSLLARLDAGSPLMGLDLAPDSSLLYCARALNFCEVGADVVILDTRTHSLRPESIKLPSGHGQPAALVVTLAAGGR